MTNRQLHRLKKQWLAEGYRMGAIDATLNEGAVGTGAKIGAGIGAVSGGLKGAALGSFLGPLGTLAGGITGAAAGAIGTGAVGAGLGAIAGVAKWAFGKLVGSLNDNQKVLGNNITAILMKAGDQLGSAIGKAQNKELASQQAFNKILTKGLSMCNQEVLTGIREDGIGGVAKIINTALKKTPGYVAPSSSQIKQMVGAYMSGPTGGGQNAQLN